MYPTGCCGDGASWGPGLGWFQSALLAIPAVTKAYSAIAGGDAGQSDCWGYNNRPFSEPCANTPNYDAVARAVDRAPGAEINILISYLLGGNFGKGPKSRADLARRECIPFWTKAIQGGKDCRASRYPDAPAWFLAFVRAWGEPLTAEEENAGSSVAGIPVKSATVLPVVAAIVALIVLPQILKKGGGR